jgi:hypothetical protein
LALVSHAPEHAELFRWAMILDIGGWPCAVWVVGS